MSSNLADKRIQIRRSALWAAYGDALGFITEGVDAAGVKRRAGSSRVEKTISWKRKIGRFGPTVALPAGCLSDDTQLRLSTSRSIRAQGEFDVETFAKIELTVWPSYALGGGVGSHAAAANLRRRDVTWATNFFRTKRSDYLQGGGNGAAMRIQPHVWALSANVKPVRLSASVVQNAVATHGHPRGILGAVFHAHCLHHALTRDEVPGPEVWDAIAGELVEIAELARTDPRLRELWLGQWERHTGRPFTEGVRIVADEIKADLDLCRDLDLDGGADSYLKAVKSLDAVNPAQRGSGTKTAILAAILGRLFHSDPDAAVITAANCLRTDTDTIATMAGAMVGAVARGDPSNPIADRDYIVHEADRMWAVGIAGNLGTFRYPSLVTWTPPKSASDCVGVKRDGFDFAGLGAATPDSDSYEGSDKAHSAWQWLNLWFGQRVLAKRRARPEKLPESQSVQPTPQYLELPAANGADPRAEPSQSSTSTQVSFEELVPRQKLADHRHPDGSPSIHELTRDAIASGFDPAFVGKLLLDLADRDDGVEASIAYAAIIAKARISRRR
jgi:ADP-ribosylglycohydrolase